MSKHVALIILLTTELWQLLAVIAEPDHYLAGKANHFDSAAQNTAYYRKTRGLGDLLRWGKKDEWADRHGAGASTSSLAMAGSSSFDCSPEGSSKKYTLVEFNGGVKLQDDSLVAIHLLEDHEIDPSKHGFPDIQGNIVPPKVNMNDVLEVCNQGEFHTVSVTSHLLITSKFGSRTLWGAVPAFQFDNELTPGSPIFRHGKLVSIITKSDGKGKYAVSGISDVSGHFDSHEVSVNTMTDKERVYGSFIGSYLDVKNEALRTKQLKDGLDHYKIIVGVNTLRLVGWRGDNYETFHTRIGTVPRLTCGEC